MKTWINSSCTHDLLAKSKQTNKTKINFKYTLSVKLYEYFAQGNIKIVWECKLSLPGDTGLGYSEEMTIQLRYR